VAALGESVVGTAVYGPVRTVVWEDGGREAPSYPIGWLSFYRPHAMMKEMWAS
jgi:hypothetical protein